ncbi:hypothetical protein HJC23_000241 [Cyclotella cryptica]|uniref:Uncharacterized protein n=1 Tax=Cyclotella cryptica TaxID=29204 RepID=A0ABD3PMG5_9STRA
MSKPSSSDREQQTLSLPAIVSMALLALQFGIQPSVTKRYTSPEIIKSTVIFLQEVVKLVLAVLGISLSSDGWSKATAGWNAITYNVLNQTKTLSAAMCCYLLLGKRQSGMQMLALVLLLMAALEMEGLLPLDALLPSYWTDRTKPESHFSSGRKSKCSSLHDGIMRGIHPSLTDFISKSDDGAQIRQRGFFDQWTLFTILPILTNAAGGILVGLVIKYAGTVQKGFALIFGILISGLLQGSLSKEEMAGGVMAGISLWMHSTYPYLANIGENAPLENGVTIAKATKAANAGRRGRKSRKED